MNLITILTFTTILLSGFSACYKITGHDSIHTSVYLSKAPSSGEKLKTFLEKLKEKMKVGDETLGLPVLDPFEKKLIGISVNESTITLEGLLSNFKVFRASEYTVNNATLGQFGFLMMMNLTWPDMQLSTHYVINGSSGSYPIFGHGHMDATFSNLTFATTLRLSVREVKSKMVVYVKEMKSAIHLESAKFRIDGLYNDDGLSELISTIVSDMVPDIIEDYQKDITEMLNAKFMAAANEKLSSFTIKDLMDMISK